MTTSKVLLVQNSISTAKIIGAILEANNFHVIDTVQNMQDAVARVKDQNPDLIIMNLKQNGDEDQIDKIQNIMLQFSIPVIFLTGNNDNFLKITEKLLPYNFLTKPFKSNDLISAVKISLYMHGMTAKIKESEEQLRAIQSAIATILIGVSVNDTIYLWNNIAEKTFGLTTSEALGKLLIQCEVNWDKEKLYEGIAQSIVDNKPVKLDEIRFINTENKTRFLDIIVNPVKDKHGKLNGFLITGEDISDRKQLEQRLSHAKKLESIGRLSSGIAHEINTPTQYIFDNILFLKNSFLHLTEIVKQNNNLIEDYKYNDKLESIVKDLKSMISKYNIEYLKDEIPKAIDQSIEGLDRISGIVRSMTQFSNPETDKKIPLDINKAIDNTITITRNEWKYCSNLSVNYEKALPPISCYPWEFNHVILNLITNASDAIKEKIGPNPKEKGKIDITTSTEGNMAIITIKDNGSGIPEEIKDRIFDPFFTTKDVGKGTGQGLSIAYDVIVNKHSGKLDVESKVGKGTTFTICLAIKN
jgi:two-component system, NtrC family, sensor kinase